MTAIRPAAVPRKVLVDTDPGLLVGGLDVDDDLALLFLLGSPEIEVVAVTTAYGNTTSGLAFRDAKRLLALAGRPDIPVLRGAGFRSRHLRPTDASRAILDFSRRYAGELTVLSIAPPTNVAAALAEDPEAASRIRELVLMGGCAREGSRQFNFRMHPEATRAVLAADCAKAAIPHELCTTIAMKPADVSSLAREGSLVARFRRKLARFSRLQAVYRARKGGAKGGFHPWDVIAAAWLVEPALFSDVRELHATVDDHGRTRFGKRGGGPAVKVPHAIDIARFRTLFHERIPRVAAP
jgi:inosine-uridine nucleoside N-ribohydrolase